MSGAAVARKPRSGRTVLAFLLLIVMVAAFAAAFYEYGGTEIVAGLLRSAPFGLLGGSSTPAATVATSTPSAAATFPPGVDEAFAKRVYLEQLESEVNIQKLVNGEVTKFTYGKVDRTGSDAVIQIRAYFKDGSSAPGVVGLASKQGKWFVAYVAGRATAGTTGLASTVSRRVNENSPQRRKQMAEAKVDIDVVLAMLQQQVSSQDTLANLVNSDYSVMTVEKVTPGQGTATVEVSLVPKSGSPEKAQLICITKQVDGKDTWFITTFRKV
jgi:hypothetical protein